MIKWQHPKEADGGRKQQGGGRGKENGRKTPGSLETKVKTDCEIDKRRKNTVSVGRGADGGGRNRVGDAPTTRRSNVQEPSKTEIDIHLIKV